MAPTDAAATGARSAAEPDLAAAHEKMLATPGLQFDFANYSPPKPPGWLKGLFELFDVAAPVMKYVFWTGLALGVALLLFFIGRELLGARFGWRRRSRVKREADWRPEPGAAKALLADADRLAGEGRFDEAVHLLLFRSIDDLSGRRPGAVRPALTSRDISRMDAMPPAARAAFGQIAAVVERSFFGGARMAESDFAACRRAYEGFALAEGWT